MLETAIKELTLNKKVVIDKIGVYVYITYNEDKYEMTQYTNQSSFLDEFLDDIQKKSIKPQDIGLYEGKLSYENSKKAIIEFLNVYSECELELYSILS